MSILTRNGLGKWRPLLWGLLAIPLLAAAIGMQLSDEVNWTAADFAVAVTLLGGSGLAIEALAGLAPTPSYRWAAITAVAGLLLLTWSNLAVGIVGSQNDPFNLFYFLEVPLVGLGAVLTRLKARGMAIVMTAAAALPSALAGAAFSLGKHLQPGDSAQEVVVVNAIFIIVFAASAMLFWRAAD